MFLLIKKQLPLLINNGNYKKMINFCQEKCVITCFGEMATCKKRILTAAITAMSGFVLGRLAVWGSMNMPVGSFVQN